MPVEGEDETPEKEKAEASLEKPLSLNEQRLMTVLAAAQRAARRAQVYTLSSWNRNIGVTGPSWRRGWDLNPRTTLQRSTP